MNRNHLTRALSLLAVFALATGCATSGKNVRRHPEFNARYPEMQTIAVAAPDVSLVLTKNLGPTQDWLGEGDTLLIEDMPRVADDLARLVSEALAERGLEPMIVPLEEFDFQRLAQAEEQSVAAREASETPLTLTGTLREKVASWGESAEVRDLLLISIRGRKRTGGSVARGFLGKILIGVGTMGFYTPPGDATGFSLLSIMFVDSESGNILWTNSEYDISTEPKAHRFDTGNIADLVEKVFKPLPPRQPMDVSGLDEYPILPAESPVIARVPAVETSTEEDWIELEDISPESGSAPEPIEVPEEAAVPEAESRPEVEDGAEAAAEESVVRVVRVIRPAVSEVARAPEVAMCYLGLEFNSNTLRATIVRVDVDGNMMALVGAGDKTVVKYTEGVHGVSVALPKASAKKREKSMFAVELKPFVYTKIVIEAAGGKNAKNRLIVRVFEDGEVVRTRKIEL